MTLGDDVPRGLDEEAHRSGESRSRLVERTPARQLAGSGDGEGAGPQP